MNNKPDCEQTSEFASGNIFLRRVRLEKEQDKLPGHTHNFDHTTFVTKGRVHVLATCPDGCAPPLNQDFEAGDYFLVRANWQHEITALTDKVEFFCIYSHRNPQGEVVQAYNGWKEAYQ